MKISIDDAIKLAEIGVTVLGSLRSDGVQQITSAQIEKLYVNANKLRELREEIRGNPVAERQVDLPED